MIALLQYLITALNSSIPAQYSSDFVMFDDSISSAQLSEPELVRLELANLSTETAPR